ncbi:hypothetical protein C8R45DRAFT_995545 [Mycena sanguinolenta]|nr:hypothetical protein C8R45DRAFT_995545 [Mycena sanguinolenta]
MSASVTQNLPHDLKLWLDSCQDGPPTLPPHNPPFHTASEVDTRTPVPDHLRTQECVYGYEVSDAVMQTYFKTRPVHEPPPPLESFLWVPYKRFYIQKALDELGLTLSVEDKSSPPGPAEDIVYFAYTFKGEIKSGVPEPEQLKRFEEELGLTEPPRWHDSGIAWRNIRY